MFKADNDVAITKFSMRRAKLSILAQQTSGR